MAAEYSEFVSSVPTHSLGILLSFVKGAAPDKADLAIAAINVESYAAGMFLGDPSPIPLGAEDAVTAPTPSYEAVEEAIVRCLPAPAAVEGVAVEAPLAADKGVFLTLLQFAGPLILKLLVGAL
jgi:hypothetical protein